MPRHSINRPTVLHVDTERGWRGGQRQALWLAQALPALGYESILVARPGGPLATRAAAAGVTVEPLRPVAEFDPVAAWRLRRLIRASGASIVHAHSGHAVALGALAIRGTSAALVVTRRVDYFLRANFASRWKYAQASAVIAISSAVVAALRASDIGAERIVLIPSGIDMDRIIPRITRYPALQDIGAPRVVQVSQLVGHKDPLTFVRAIDAARRLVPGLRALLVGDGPLRGAVEALVAELRLGDVLTVTGYRDDADALIASADVVTLSSNAEGLGTVLLDAMAFGGTVAATAAGGIPEIVVDGVTGLLAPIGDGPALGARIAQLLTDRPLAERLKAAARERVREFSIERTATKTAEVYQRVSRGQR